MQVEAKPQSKIVKYGGGFLGAMFLLAIAAVIFIPKNAPMPSAQATAALPQAAQPPSQATIPPGISISDFQKTFMAVIDDTRAKYQATDNQLAKSALVTERNARFEKLKGDPRKITDWVGRIEHIGTTGDGKAHISIALADNLTFTTFNLDFADAQDHTLIPQSSPLYKKMMTMKEGDQVKFSGRLKRTIDITEAGRMIDPNFLFVFSDISKI